LTNRRSRQDVCEILNFGFRGARRQSAQFTSSLGVDASRVMRRNRLHKTLITPLTVGSTVSNRRWNSLRDMATTSVGSVAVRGL